jgi:hypothetical protein
MRISEAWRKYNFTFPIQNHVFILGILIGYSGVMFTVLAVRLCKIQGWVELASPGGFHQIPQISKRVNFQISRIKARAIVV